MKLARIRDEEGRVVYAQGQWMTTDGHYLLLHSDVVGGDVRGWSVMPYLADCSIEEARERSLFLQAHDIFYSVYSSREAAVDALQMAHEDIALVLR